MNLKLVLAFTLLSFIILGMMTFGYTVYTINGDVASNNGAKIVTAHKPLLYGQLALYILQFVFGGLVIFKTN